jgi:hypothetical protein
MPDPLATVQGRMDPVSVGFAVSLNTITRRVRKGTPNVNCKYGRSPLPAHLLKRPGPSGPGYKQQATSNKQQAASEASRKHQATSNKQQAATFCRRTKWIIDSSLKQQAASKCTV